MATVNHWHYEAGADVPEHILGVIPIEPGAKRPRVFFSVATDVFETADRFVCMPQGQPGSGTIMVVSLPGEGVSEVFAASKIVDAVGGWARMTPTNRDGPFLLFPAQPAGSA